MTGLDLLGDQLSSCLTFARSEFKTDLVLRDEVTASDEKIASEIFSEQGGRWFMNQESLPGDTSIKAIAVDEDQLLIETSPLDLKRVNDLIIEEMLPLSVSEQGEVMDLTTNQVIAKIGEVQTPTFDDQTLSPRCLWVVE